MSKFLKASSLFKDISSLITFKKKKRRIIFSITLSNIIVGLDILIILYFTNFLTGESFGYLDSILVFKYLLPVFIVLRFFAFYLDTMNIHYLRLGVEEEIRKNLVQRIFRSGSLSSSDSYFYLNVLAPNVGAFYQYFATLISSLIQVTVFSVYILITNTNEFIYIGFGGVLLIPIIRTFIKLGRKSSHRAFTYHQEVSDEIEKVIENLFLIKILKKTDIETEKFSKYLRTYYSAQISNQKYGTLNSLLPLSLSTFLMSILLLFFNLSFMTLDFIAVIIRSFQALGVLNKNLSLAATQFVYIENFKTALDINEHKNTNNYRTIPSTSEKLAIKLDDIDFRYALSDSNIFENLDIEILKDKKYLILGPNGAGKSTLMGLMAGIYIPTRGKIISTISRNAYVSAYPMILRDTLKANLMYGNENKAIKDEEIYDIANKLKLYEAETKDYLNNMVSNKTLSSGQMQKVAFIRAFLSEPEILFLDESTANLDQESKVLLSNIISKKHLTIVNSTHNIEDFEDYDYKITIKPFEGKQSKVALTRNNKS